MIFNIAFVLVVTTAVFTSPVILWLAIPVILLEVIYAQQGIEPNYIPPVVDNSKADLANFLYMKQNYLASPQWKEKRLQVLKRDNHCCQNCGLTHHLTVHHMSGYNLIPNEPISALTTLCNSCHTSLHERMGYPQSYHQYMTYGY